MAKSKSSGSPVLSVGDGAVGDDGSSKSISLRDPGTSVCEGTVSGGEVVVSLKVGSDNREVVRSTVVEGVFSTNKFVAIPIRIAIYVHRLILNRLSLVALRSSTLNVAHLVFVSDYNQQR